jgi:hypothetical protein
MTAEASFILVFDLRRTASTVGSSNHSRIHPLSSLSASQRQREAIPSHRQMQRLLGKNYGSRNLSILHPPRPISLIRRHSPLLCSTASPLRFQIHFPVSAPEPWWCAPSLRSSPHPARNDHREPPPQIAIISPQAFHWVLRIISCLIMESLKCS